MSIHPEKPPLPRHRRLRAGRYGEPYCCYSITKCVEDRRRVLGKPQSVEAILEPLTWLRKNNHIKVLAFCIMPDHYHLLLVLLEGKSLNEVMNSIGKHAARRINEHFGNRGRLWQDGYYEHRCRDDKEIHQSLSYIEHNPVRAGLAEQPEIWPYSSAFPGHAALLDRDWCAENS